MALLPRVVVVTMALGCLATTSCRSEAGDTDVFADSEPSSGTSAAEPGPAAPGSGGRTDADRRISRPAPSGPVEPIDLGTVDLDDWTLTEADAGEALDFYADYLVLSDAALMGDDDAQAELDFITDPLVRYLTDDWQTRNELLADEGLSIVGMSSKPNVIALTGSEEGAVVHDCVSLEVTDELTQITRTEHVEQITVLRQTSDLWLVSLVEVLHSGTIDSGPVRCVTNGERAAVEAVMTEALDGLAAAWADPRSGAGHLSGVVGADLLERVEREIGSMAGDGVYTGGEQTSSIDVVGAYLPADTTSYLVTSCTAFPRGLVRRSIETGQPVDDGSGEASAPPAGAVYREWTVAVGPDGPDDGSPGGRLLVTTLDMQRVGSSCDGGSES